MIQSNTQADDLVSGRMGKPTERATGCGGTETCGTTQRDSSLLVFCAVKYGSHNDSLRRRFG